MSQSTWIWNGASADVAIASDWTLVAGPGNLGGVPAPGDVAIIPAGTILGGLDTTLQGRIVDIGGTAAVAAFSFADDNSLSVADPNIESDAVIGGAVPGNSTAAQTLLDASGLFYNEGNIRADGPAGSLFTADITANGTAAAGAFINTGTIRADAGNTLINRNWQFRRAAQHRPDHRPRRHRDHRQQAGRAGLRLRAGLRPGRHRRRLDDRNQREHQRQPLRHRSGVRVRQ